MSLTVQFYTMLSMIGMGAFVGAALDTYHRFLQRPKRKKRWLVFIQDVLFWTIQAFLIFYVLWLVNEADLRFYIFIALFCGFAAYQSLFKKIYLRILELVIRVTIQVYKFVWKLCQVLIIKPIVLLVQASIAIVVFLGHMLQKVIVLLYRFTVRLLWLVWKIIFTPLQIIGRVVWKVLPSRVKIFIRQCAGFLRYIEKMKVKVMHWWKYIKTKIRRPRE